MRGANFPTFSEVQEWSVNRAGEYEVLRQTLYDFQTYPDAGALSTAFFQVQAGQSGKTIHDTNMELAGQLPAPKHFLVQSIEVFFLPAPAVGPVTVAAGTTDLSVSVFTNDVYSVLRAGALDFFIGSKSYLQEAPLLRFPPKTRLKPEFATSSILTQTTEADLSDQVLMDYASGMGRPYNIDPWVLIAPTQNFSVTISFSSLVAVDAATDARIGVVLDGLLYRLSQ